MFYTNLKFTKICKMGGERVVLPRELTFAMFTFSSRKQPCELI